MLAESGGVGGQVVVVVVGCFKPLPPKNFKEKKKKVKVPEHKHTQKRGLHFWSKPTDYKILIIYVQARCRALITRAHTRVHTALLLKIDPQAVARRCCAEEFITSVMHCCAARRHKHATLHANKQALRRETARRGRY